MKHQQRLLFIIYYLLFGVVPYALVGCSHIDEGERLIYVEPAYSKPEAVSRAVLLEDFTGQRCVNCPRGTEVIEQLQQELGDSLFIAVGIHSGPLGFKGTAKALGLATDDGDEYYNYWKLEYQPVGLINRHGAVNYTDWTAEVVKELARTATLKLTAEAAVSGSQADITVNALGTDGTTTGKLQVWLLEDGITALQMMPDGSTDTGYVHNHVLRTPVNGTWGQDFTVSESEERTFTFSQPINETWNRLKLSIVAFVYNDSGVLQATKAKVKN